MDVWPIQTRKWTIRYATNQHLSSLICLTLSYSEQPKLHRVLAVLHAIGLKTKNKYMWQRFQQDCKDMEVYLGWWHIYLLAELLLHYKT